MRRLASLLRGLLLIAVIAAAVGFVGWLAYHFVLRPQITINAPLNSSISVYQLPGSHIVDQFTTRHQSETISLDPGTYRVQVLNASAAVGATYYDQISLFGRITHATNDRIQLHTTLDATQTAYNAMQSGAGIVYLDTTEHSLKYRSADGTIVIIGTAGVAQMLAPIADDEAIVLMSNTLFVLQHNQLAPLSTRGFPNPVTTLSIGTNQLQSEFVIAANQKLYAYASPESTPRFVTELSQSIDRLAFGGTQIIAYSTRMPAAVEDISSAYTAYAIDPLVIDSNTKKVETLTKGPISEATISPDGQLATIQLRQSSTTNIYRLGTRQKMYEITNPDETPLWITDTSLTYGKGTSLWQLDVDARRAILIGKISQGAEITSMSYASDKIFFATAYDGPDRAYIYQLQTVNGNGSKP